ncbi:MAG TPA: CaiB/BaiF CoA-transferase family protein [Acidimicrobiales bacterium]|nr:CaiB/BaiF CoA-transferase family protein [Acidimicrobiales bacterium]
MTATGEARPDLADGPMTGVRVIEFGLAIAGPYACSMLGDLGAEVIKVESRTGGDSHRRMGPSHNGATLWWTVVGRNKKSVTLDVKTEEGRAVFLDLVARSDALVENFRPGVLEGLGLDPDTLFGANPDLVVARVSGFGQTGPYASRRGFGKIAEAFSGASNLTGEADGNPIHPGYSLGDTVTGLTAAFAITAALRARDLGHGGQVIDLALYEGLFRMIDWQIPVAALTGLNARRQGVGFPLAGAFLTGIWPASDGRYVVVSAATADTQERIFRLLQQEGELAGMEWAFDPDVVGEIVKATERWIAVNPSERVFQVFEDAGAVAGIVHEPMTLLEDPHIRARQNIVDVEHPTAGTIPMPGVVPAMSATPGRVRHVAPELGQHTDEVLASVLGYDPERIATLRASGVV